MAEFKRVDDETFTKARDRGAQVFAGPRATSARLDRRRRRIVVGLETGAEFAFDPACLAGLRNVSFGELEGVVVEGVGDTLRFPRLDADFSVSRLIESLIPPTGPLKRVSTG